MKKVTKEVCLKNFTIQKEVEITLENKTIILEKGDTVLIHEIEKYESSNFDQVFYEHLVRQVKKWGQHFEYRMGIHVGFIVKDLIREGIRFNLTDSIEPFITGYKGRFEI